MKYRKKPVVIEAEIIAHLIKAAESNWNMLPDWVKENYEKGKIIFISDHVEITTDEGVMRGEKNDYLIRGIKGEIYPCKPDIFEKTYELADDTP